jgi:hypothetical protein
MTTQSIKTFLTVTAAFPTENPDSILLRGPHGIGKSQVVRQVARRLGLNVIDRRLSQMSEGDMIGLPSTDGETTRFNPPDWFKSACNHPVVLFLDELNRATPEVMQAAFQIVLDRELNGWKLHPRTFVFAAVNDSAAYTVNEMDPALLDRFYTVDLVPSHEDWLIWARGEGKITESIIDFIAQEEKWLDTPRDAEPGKVHRSRRSWERLSRALVTADVADKADDPVFYPLCLGYIGTEATIAFHSFVKTMDNQVSGQDVIENWKKVEKKVKKMGQERILALSDKVATHVSKMKTLGEPAGPNLRSFMETLPAELKVSFWTKMISGSGIDKLDIAREIHKWCAPAIMSIYAADKAAGGGTSVPATAVKKKK